MHDKAWRPGFLVTAEKAKSVEKIIISMQMTTGVCTN
jgi:hypothetical protein